MSSLQLYSFPISQNLQNFNAALMMLGRNGHSHTLLVGIMNDSLHMDGKRQISAIALEGKETATGRLNCSGRAPTAERSEKGLL